MNKLHSLYTSFTLNRMIIVLLLGLFWLSICFGTSHVLAEELSPVGLWKTVSDKTGEPKSFVMITLENGELVGKIEKLIRKPGQNPNPLCKNCPGDKKDQPIQGMGILWGLTEDEDEWSGGYILDPNNGKSYKCLVQVVENGRKLQVRGYIGFSIFGRTQIWHRVE